MITMSKVDQKQTFCKTMQFLLVHLVHVCDIVRTSVIYADIIDHGRNHWG